MKDDSKSKASKRGKSGEKGYDEYEIEAVPFHGKLLHVLVGWEQRSINTMSMWFLFSVISSCACNHVVMYWVIKVCCLRQHISLSLLCILCNLSSFFARKHHRRLPDSTLWLSGKGWHAIFPSKTIHLEADREVQIVFKNKLVYENGTWVKHFTPVDQSLHWANPMCDERTCIDELYDGPIPMAVHMHGFNTTDDSDGHPDAWFLPDAKGINGKYNRHGPMWEIFSEKSTWGPWPKDSQVSITTSRRASSRWYHDHTVGMTRWVIACRLSCLLRFFMSCVVRVR